MTNWGNAFLLPGSQHRGGVRACGPPGWQKAKDDADQTGAGDRDEGHGAVELDWPAEGGRYGARKPVTDGEAEQPADCTQQPRFQQELLSDVSGAGAESKSNPDLVGPFGNRHEH